MSQFFDQTFKLKKSAKRCCSNFEKICVEIAVESVHFSKKRIPAVTEFYLDDVLIKIY